MLLISSFADFRSVLEEVIPCGVSPGLKCGAQAAGREAGGVGFAFDQLFAGEFHDDSVFARRGYEAVVLLGGDARHGLEPVGEMSGALFDGPVLHGGCDGRGQMFVQGLLRVNQLVELGIDLGRESVAHDIVVKYVAANKSWTVDHKNPPMHAAPQTRARNAMVYNISGF